MKTEITVIIFVLLFSLFAVFGLSTKYTISFESNGGNLISAIQIEGESLIEKPDDPVKDGFLFDGWFLDDVTYILPFDLDAPVKTSLTVYAKWIKIEDSTQVAIEFVSHHQSIIIYFEKGEQIIPPSWTLEGYELDGWYEHSPLEPFNLNDEVAQKDMTLYAYWLIKVKLD